MKSPAGRPDSRARTLFPRLRSLAYGATLLPRAAATICSSPMLLLWSILPISVTLAIYIWLLGWLHELARELLGSYFHLWGWNPEGWAAGLVTFLSKLLLILISALTFSFTSAVVASPFNDLLAQRAESFARPPLPPAPRRSWRGKAGLVGIDLLKSVTAALGMLAALLLSWVPALNLAAFALSFLLVTFQYISYPQTRRGVGLSGSFDFVLRHPLACLSFGATVSALFAIPVVSVLALPLAVVGGTLLYARAPGDHRHFPLK